MDLMFAILVVIGLTNEPDSQPHGEFSGRWFSKDGDDAGPGTEANGPARTTDCGVLGRAAIPFTGSASVA